MAYNEDYFVTQKMKDIFLEIIYLLIIYVLFTSRYCIMIFWSVYCWIYDETRMYNFIYVNYITVVHFPGKVIRYLSIECGLKQSSAMSSHKLSKNWGACKHESKCLFPNIFAWEKIIHYDHDLRRNIVKPLISRHPE